MSPQRTAAHPGVGQLTTRGNLTCRVVRVNGWVPERLGEVDDHPVIALLLSPTQHTVRELLDQGVAALVDASQGVSPQRIRSVVAQVDAHGAYVDPCLQRMALGRRTGAGHDCPLSPRQHDVLSLYAQNHERSRIARALRIEPGTVDDHYQAVRERLGVRSMADAVAVARREGWL